ncbi:MAG: phenylalanine--tRNA ligase subunit beta [Rhodospirillales bacterium]|nr:phenylalanine--tRNA ligase subunit beta [Rhodospirillales bacterium]
MKFSMQWLEKDLETTASVQEIADTLTMIGLEIESVDDPAEKLKGFVVAHVIDAKPHPDADRLQVCTVDTGNGTFEVVCGAPNARAGMKGVFAGEGSYIPGIDVTLKKTKIRGVESNGMLLSEREMGLSDDHDGIVELPGDAPLGAIAADIMGLSDPVFDIAVTPNRADCLGVRGIARDLAAAGIGALKPIDLKAVKSVYESPVSVVLDLGDAADACPYFVGRHFRGIKNGPSPDWLQEKLLQIGLRPISALVDITNLMTIAYCRPLHVFDADKLIGNIHVRLGKKGEKFLALDGKEYELDDEMTVIADDAQADGLGGVMGGDATSCTGDTVNVFLESAYFDPARTAMTGRKLNLLSDARFRFERGIDPAFLIEGAEIASQLIQSICGGDASELVIAGQEPAWQRSYFLRQSRVAELGGVQVPGEKIEKILTDLGFTVTAKDGGWDAAVPSWRRDVVGEADLVEEVIRINGFDNIPAVSLPSAHALPTGAVNLAQDRRGRARRGLAGRGLTEAVTYSFLPSAHADLFGGVPDEIHLANPISSDLDVMRPSILPNLIAAVGRNADRGFSDISLFEVGPQYAGEAPDDQSIVAAGVRAGNIQPRAWTNRPRAADVFDAKADVLDILAQIGAPAGSVQVTNEAPAWYHPGRSGSLQLGPKTVLAHFGEIHPRVLAAMDVAGPIAAFEIYLDTVPSPKAGRGTARAKLELSPFQSVTRDFAFVVDDKVAADSLARAAKSADSKLITEVRVFDVFTGGDMEAGKKSIAIAVTLQPAEATLTDSEIEAVSDKIVANATKQTGGVLRG